MFLGTEMMRSAGQIGKKFITFSYWFAFTFAYIRRRELRAIKKAYDLRKHYSTNERHPHSRQSEEETDLANNTKRSYEKERRGAVRRSRWTAEEI